MEAEKERGYKKRITITCYDDEGYDLLTKYPLLNELLQEK